jgi:release factor glutamine methyltransferase
MNTPLSVTSSDWLKLSTSRLKFSGIGTAHLDVLVLLEDCLNQERGYLLAHPEQILTAVQIRRLNVRLEQRLKHIPLAYVRRKSEFYGRVFYIDERVLEPRPETETMIDLFAKLPIDQQSIVADIGTGSGCIGITIKLDHPTMQVDLYDIDQPALSVARLNANRFKIKVNFYRTDLLTTNHGPYNVILANLPYVPTKYKINEAVANEPKIAIFGGSDGLDVYRQLFKQLTDLNWRPDYILTESLPFQHQSLHQIATKSQFQLIDTDDFIQCFKAI